MSSKPKGHAKPKPTAKSVGAAGRGSGGAAGRGIAGPTGRGGAAVRGRGTTGGSVGRGRGESIPTGGAAVRGRGSSVPTRGATVRGRGSSVPTGGAAVIGRPETLPTRGVTANRVRTRGGLGAGGRGKGKEHAVDPSTSAGVGEADRGVEPSTFPLPARSPVAPSGNPNQTPSGNPNQTSPGGVTARSSYSSNPCSENTTSINRTRIPAQYTSSSQQRPRLQLGIETATSLPPPQNRVDEEYDDQYEEDDNNDFQFPDFQFHEEEQEVNQQNPEGQDFEALLDALLHLPGREQLMRLSEHPSPDYESIW